MNNDPVYSENLHVQERFILFQLKLDPGRVFVAVSVVLGEHSDSLLTLVVDVEPTRGLRDEPCEENNQTREEHLKVHGDGPAHVAFESNGTANGTRSQDGASEPESVAVSGDNATVGRVSGLDDINWTRSRDDRYTETEDKAAGLKLTKIAVQCCGSVDDRSNDDDPGADLHANLSSPGVDSGTDEEKSADTTDLVHSRVECSPFTVVGTVEEVKELLVGSESTKDGAVKAVLWPWVSCEIHVSEYDSCCRSRRDAANVLPWSAQSNQAEGSRKASMSSSSRIGEPP